LFGMLSSLHLSFYALFYGPSMNLGNGFMIFRDSRGVEILS
jgi:hypothetical protein